MHGELVSNPKFTNRMNPLPLLTPLRFPLAHLSSRMPTRAESLEYPPPIVQAA